MSSQLKTQTKVGLNELFKRLNLHFDPPGPRNAVKARPRFEKDVVNIVLCLSQSRTLLSSPACILQAELIYLIGRRS